MWKNQKIVAVILAAGSGRRMNAPVKKQYMELGNKPLIFYSLQVFDTCEVIDEIVLVTAKEEQEYCRNEIIERYGIRKVTSIIEGGEERYHSVYRGLCAIEECGYVLIHDGARPFVTEEIILLTLEGADECQACAAGIPVKDTIRLVDDKGFTKETPNRNSVWIVQTPQTFSYIFIKDAFELYMKSSQDIPVTDDVMVAELMTGQKAKMIQGSYLNIKITTPEDLKLAEVFLSK